MWSAPRRWVDRAASVGVPPGASDAARERAGLFLVMAPSGVLAGGLWAIGYLLLGRPVSAAVPGGFAVIVALGCVWLVLTRRLTGLRQLLLVLILLLPAILQATLGGYVKGSAVIVWSFYAPLGALLFFSIRAAAAWLAAFLFLVVVSAVFEPYLSAVAPPLPGPVATALFAFNLIGVASTTMLVLAVFRVQRDEAMAVSERLLLNVLPEEIAVRLKHNEYPIADRFEEVSVLFADVAGFTARSASEEPEQTVQVLNDLFSRFDGLASQLGLRPIRTTGDSYLVVGGLPVPIPNACEAMAEMALGMLEAVSAVNREATTPVNLRIGINIGPVVAAVVGHSRFSYDVWSDAVNTASRMESTGVPGRIQVTEAAYERLRHGFSFEPRGELEVKGKGSMKTYFLTGRTAKPPSERDA